VKKPKWQRARIIKDNSSRMGSPTVVGREVWMLTERPHQIVGVAVEDHMTYRIQNAVHSQIIDSDGRPVAMGSDYIELLARGPEDFADEVPLVKWEDWLKESAPEKTT